MVIHICIRIYVCICISVNAIVLAISTTTIVTAARIAPVTVTTIINDSNCTHSSASIDHHTVPRSNILTITWIIARDTNDGLNKDRSKKENQNTYA